MRRIDGGPNKPNQNYRQDQLRENSTMKRSALVLIGFLASLRLSAAEPASPSIFEAIRGGNNAAVRELLSGGADIEARNEIGDTPLMAAAWTADAAMVELLIKAGADVKATNELGATALMRAATFEDKVRVLVARGADVKVRSKMGNTALILAARQAGNSATVKFLLVQGAQVNEANVFGATPLMAAAAAGDLASVKLLLDSGADVNAKPKMSGNGLIWGGGRTALMWAAFYGNEPLVKLLLEQGAKVNDFTLFGGALAQAAWGGHARVARLLLDAGAKVDGRDLVANYTPLHWAACSEKSSTTIAELLLARGADANAEGGQPVDNFLGEVQTPLMLARKRGETAIVQLLLKAGANDPPGPVRLEKPTEKAPDAASGSSAPEAIARAMPRLSQTAEQSVATFLRHASKQDCISCHQQQLPLMALSLAHSRNIATDRPATRRQVELVKRSFLSGQIREGDERYNLLEVGLQTTFHPEPSITNGYTAMDLRLEQEPTSPLTDSMVHQLGVLQHPDGHWSWNLPRPPIQASDITATAQAVYTLRFYGIPARRQEMGSRIQRARAWLAQAQAETNEERAHKVLGLYWADDQSELLRKLADELVREQRPDGGWAQLAGLESDTYATGQSLYALIEGGKLSASNPALERAIGFLLRTQLADGTWHVRSRAHPFQPPMESGFPHGRDGWISSAGTSWAVIALATSLTSSRPAPNTVALASASPPVPAGAPISASDSAVPVDFTRDIKPLFERSCVRCHGGLRPKGGFPITNRETLLKGGNRGEPVVVPGEPGNSPLLHFVQDQVADLEMPPLAMREKFPALSKEEIQKLSAWITQGADWPTDVRLKAPAK
jgi:ankyrin repeat protein/mono/diheme cytochrome c family protein